MERLAGRNEHVLFVLVNCDGPDAAPKFAKKHKIKHCLHFHQSDIPAEFANNGIPHEVILAIDGTVLKNADYPEGSTVEGEVAFERP